MNLELFQLEFATLDPYFISMFGGFRLSDHEAHGKTIARVYFPDLKGAMEWREGTEAILSDYVDNPDHGVILELDVTKEMR